MQSPVVGVFDSGFGGLTVLRALLPMIPGAHYLYLGDTARLPYGAKSQATIARFAVESARFLASRGAGFLVIACNTATALALDDIRSAVDIPVLGVIEPGVHAAAAALIHSAHPGTPGPVLQLAGAPGPDFRTRAEQPSPPPVTPTGSPQPQPSKSDGAADKPVVLVLATAATVQSHAYRAACARIGLAATEKACPLLVPLVEEGWVDHPVTRDVLRIYLREALAECTPQSVLLGCTHYPLIATEIQRALRDLGSPATVVDSAHSTAAAAAAALGLSPVNNGSHPASFECFATDSVEKFARLGSLFLQQSIPQVHHLDLGG
jgi:glutamate racemase